MITIPSMPTRFRSLPELEIDLDAPQLRELAYALDRVRTDGQLRNGLCIAVAGMAPLSVWPKFSHAVTRGMNRDGGKRYQQYAYLDQYLGEDDVVGLKELTEIRQAWASHIARSIYEQIGA